MPGLLSLPNELLQQIAFSLPCSSVLSLLRVNHELRNACNDRLVFQTIVRNDLDHIYPSNSKFHTKQLPNSDCESILASASLDETVRLAFATERCIEASIAKDDTWTLRTCKQSNTLDVVEWLPQMLVLQHSAALELKPETFLQLQGELQPLYIGPSDTGEFESENFDTVNFILTYLLLSRLCHGVPPAEIKEPFDRFFPVQRPTDRAITIDEGRRIDGDAITSLRRRVFDYGEFQYTFDLEQATALLPALILEVATYDLTALELDELPLPGRIPLMSLLDMPPVFQHSATPPFGECHVGKMATPEFLSGTWMGFYSDQRGALDILSFNPPMRSIRMVSRAPDRPEIGGYTVTAVIDRETLGVDSHGEFSLQRSVTEGGFVRVTKRYTVHGWSWLWYGRLTPFGMVGVWGSEYESFGGYFWIWKEEWTNRLAGNSSS